jgi:SAM-dependent methyltransferase
VATSPHAHAAEPSGYEPELFAELAALEPSSWWFRARNRLIARTVAGSFPGARDVLEVGCGTGYTLTALARALPQARLTGVELFEEGLEHARRRMPTAQFRQLDVRRMPYREAFDLVCAFDVLEHIDDDTRALDGMRAALRPNGGLVLTVPQHPWLWSQADTYAQHERRYTRRELVTKLERAGFRIDRCTSFVTLLMPLMIASRVRERMGAKFDPLSEFRIPRVVDRFFDAVAGAEQAVLATGVSLPVGGSLLAVARRR